MNKIFIALCIFEFILPSNVNCKNLVVEPVSFNYVGSVVIIVNRNIFDVVVSYYVYDTKSGFGREYSVIVNSSFGNTEYGMHIIDIGYNKIVNYISTERIM